MGIYPVYFMCNFISSDDCDVESISTVTSHPDRLFPLTMDELMQNIDEETDDRDSVTSGLATLPESSYAGFERVNPVSSTPSKPRVCALSSRAQSCQLFNNFNSWLNFNLYLNLVQINQV